MKSLTGAKLFISPNQGRTLFPEETVKVCLDIMCWLLPTVIVTNRQPRLREGNVFSRVCLSTGGSYMTITHNAFDLTVQGILPQTWDLTVQAPSPLVTSGGHQWKPVQTCSLQDPPVPPAPLVLTSGGY